MCNFSSAALCHFLQNNTVELFWEIVQPFRNAKVQAAASPLSCVNLPHSAAPHLNKHCRTEPTAISLALNHLHAVWNKLDGEDFMAAFSFSFPKELQRIATVFLSMDKIQFWIHQSYSPCDRAEFSPKYTCFLLCIQSDVLWLNTCI